VRVREIEAATGQIPLPAPVAELAARAWDAIVVGAGHNGLACAAYLARAGLRVLVLERRDRIGGAATLERPFADPRFAMSPCAYLVGLLDPLVVRELGLRARGLEVFIADPNLWMPFPDGRSFGVWLDDERTRGDLVRLGVAPRDVEGYLRYSALFAEIRRRLRHGARDAWLGDSPTRAELEALLGNEQTLIDVLFEASIAEVLDDHVADQRLKDALWTQGVIGTYAGPKDPGTASIHVMHSLGDLEGRGPVWGYVRGGMGVVSFAIADAALEAGAVLACGLPAGEIVPEEGVRLEDGTLLRAPVVVCNADPKVALRLLAAQPVPGDYRARLEGWDVESPVLKLNAALARLPDWTAAPGAEWPARGVVDLGHGLEAGQAAVEACRRGEPRVAFAEIYVQTVHDPSPAPPARHLMSVFGQYAPHTLARGSWDERRDEVARQFIDLVEAFAPGFEAALIDHELLGPADIEARIGLSGGHIFQGDTRPGQMWEHRLTPRTPVPGVYLCGAATHPAGSVIALNGRNAATAVLADRGRATQGPAGVGASTRG